MSNRNKNKKETLLLRKEQILRELKYYDKIIEDSRNSKTNSSFYDDDSSDSEEFPEFAINSGPSLTDLKLQASMLRTCLHATQELTNLQILQSESNVMVEDPVFKGEPPVTESGVWREVTAECRADLVPFSVSFNVHIPDRQFASISYRNLQVVAIKSAHDMELSKSVLPGLRTPSEAVEVVLSYARAHRSRRCSLARLADRYADRLLMEPRVEGGYSLRCSRLRLVWELQNKWSPLAPFTHRLNFDLDYMEESYIKIVTSAHRQLSEPSVDTDERTRLLTKVIDTCLQAGTHTEENNTPREETSEKQNSDKPENPAITGEDSELMAPPKSVPKKVKSKLKRAGEDISEAKNFKKQRSELNGGNNERENVVSVTDGKVKSNLQAQVSRDERSLKDKHKLKSDPKLKKIQIKDKKIVNTDESEKRRAVDNIFSTKKAPDVESKKSEKDTTVNRNTEIQTNKQNNKPVSNKTKTKENDAKSKRDQENMNMTKSIENMMQKSKKDTNKQTKDKQINDKEKTGKENKINDTKKSNEIKNIQKAKQNNVIEKSKHLSERFAIKSINVKKPVNTIKNKNILEQYKTNKSHKIDVNNKKIHSQVGMKSDVKSKIPQKRSSTHNMKKNPLRISPRKLQSTLSSTQTSSNSLKNSKTNIPRLLKKPSVKPK